jgi:hypothetical protein
VLGDEGRSERDGGVIYTVKACAEGFLKGGFMGLEKAEGDTAVVTDTEAQGAVERGGEELAHVVYLCVDGGIGGDIGLTEIHPSIEKHLHGFFGAFMEGRVEKGIIGRDDTFATAALVVDDSGSVPNGVEAVDEAA